MVVVAAEPLGVAMEPVSICSREGNKGEPFVGEGGGSEGGSGSGARRVEEVWRKVGAGATHRASAGVTIPE
jgi:hypothetical protein